MLYNYEAFFKQLGGVALDPQLASTSCWHLFFIEPLIKPYSMYSVGSLEARVPTQGKYVHA